MLRKAVYLYLSYFLLLDIFIGIIIKYIGFEGIIPHPGQVIRAVLLLCFILYILNKVIVKSEYNYSLLSITTIYYIILLSIFNTLNYYNYLITINEIYDSIRPLFIILLATYTYYNKYYFISKFDNIILINFFVFSFNLLFSFITGVGLETYDNVEGSTKGFLIAGNSASILSLVFFTYFLFYKNKNKKNIIYLFISIFGMYILGTKVIFLIPFLILLFIIRDIHWKTSRVIITSIIAIPISLFTFVFLLTYINELFLPRYLPMLQRSGLIDSYSTSTIDILSNYRRISYAIDQITYQFTDWKALVWGMGSAGQIEFWSNRSFKFAAMDFIDILFKYGLIGLLLFSLYVINSIKNIRNKAIKNNYKVCLIIMLLYSFFGGYVMFDMTSGTMLGLLIGINLK